MRLFIAEKPSLARSIASGLGKITGKSEHHIEVGNDYVTWCFGHILELAPPEKYDQKFKQWSLETLPIRIPNDQWKMVIKDDAKKQYDAIGKLLKIADSVVNAGDPDREGQMLVDEVLDAHKWNGQTFRVLIANTTPEGVRDALKKMRPNSEFKPVYDAALCRARADWLTGMNFTRCATKRIGPITSIGRVQTPTLALVVARDRAIEGHVSSNYYPLHANVQTDKGAFVAVHNPEQNRITDIKIAKTIADALTGQTVKLNTIKKQERENPPLPFQLSAFQAAAEKAYGWTAKEALEVLQALYEKQLVTYPRTDCPYLPSELAGQARRIAESIVKTGLVPECAEEMLPCMNPNPAVYDDGKVEEHHGIIPTHKMPDESVPPKLRDGWRIVATRFLQTLLPPLVKDVIEVYFTHEERRFTARGEEMRNFDESWKRLEPEKDERQQEVPPLRLAGDVSSGRVTEVRIKTAKTSPPKRYTEATLIADMKSVGKYVEDPALKKILKETSGIGTAATHAAIIETLKTRKYILLAGKGKTKQIVSTPFGRYLIDNLPNALKDPGLTAAWEDALKKIEKGQANPTEFMQKIDAFVSKYVDHLKQCQFAPLPPETLKDQGGGKSKAGKGRK